MVGWLCEFIVHECAKGSLAFRKPAMAAASRRLARAEMAPRSASMALQASAPGELRGALGRLGYLSAPEAERQCLSRWLTIACWNVPSPEPQTLGLLTAALSTIH